MSVLAALLFKYYLHRKCKVMFFISICKNKLIFKEKFLTLKYPVKILCCHYALCQKGPPLLVFSKFSGGGGSRMRLSWCQTTWSAHITELYRRDMTSGKTIDIYTYI